MKPKFRVGQSVKVVAGKNEPIGQTGVVIRISDAIDPNDGHIYVIRYDVPFKNLKFDMFYEWKLAPYDRFSEHKDISQDSLMEVLSHG